MLALDQISEPPWWGVPLVAGLFGFVGVIAAQATVLVSDGLRVRREDKRRWHTDRLKMYADAIVLATKCFLDDRTSHGPISDAERRAELIDALLLKSVEIELISGKAVREAVINVGKKASAASQQLQAGEQISDEQGKDAVDVIRRFAEAVRKEIGVKS